MRAGDCLVKKDRHQDDQTEDCHQLRQCIVYIMMIWCQYNTIFINSQIVNMQYLILDVK